MRFLLIWSAIFAIFILAACGAPAPDLATPESAPVGAPTILATTAPTVGLVTATPEPPTPEGQTTNVAQAAPPAAAPAETPIPVAPVASDSQLVGSYSGILPAADAIGRVVTLELAIDGSATMTTQFIGKDGVFVESGTWVGEGDTAAVTFTQRDGQPQDNRITWTLQGSTLVSSEYDQSQYGSAGLPLTRVGSGEVVETNFEGVSFSFDSALAQSAQGAFIPAVPVEVAPALGGGAPEGIRFLFNGQTLPDFFDPTKPQVYVYPVEGLKALDPSVAEGVASLEKTLAEGTVPPADQDIFVFPLIPLSQTFHTQTKLLDFVNGKGVGFITYYSADVAPLRSQQVFWTFQGITLDGKYYVSLFWNIGSPALPEDRNISGAEYDAFAKEYETYLNNIVTVLNALPPAAFNPNLSLLENMARSLNVAPLFPTPTPGAASPEGTPGPTAEATAASAQAEGTSEAQATGQPPAAPAAVAHMMELNHNGVNTWYDATLANSAQGVTVAASPVDPNVPGGLSMGGPEHTAFAFNGEMLTNEVNPFQPQVRVYPADALKALDPAIAGEVVALKTLLSVDHTSLNDPIPVVPPFNAEQVIHPQIKYLKFKDGEGVRFVTTYAQNPAPITNDGLFYTFQGLSADGETYVTVFWPVRTDQLPNTIQDANITDDAAFMAGFEQYRADVAAMLNDLPPAAFTPNLTTLDQMIESLTVPASQN